MRLLITLLFFGQSLLIAAQPEINYYFNLVIAQSGLNIRAEPNLGAPVVTKVPYLSQVEYLSIESFGRDTIGVLKNFFRGYGHEMSWEETDYPLSGDWVKVKYKSKVGYTFNAYLGPVVENPESSDYFVLSPGENCGDRFFDLTKYHCYGVYGSEKDTEIREIKASYVVQEAGIGFLAPLITTEENQRLKLVIGSKRELPTVTSDFMIDSFTSAWPQSSEVILKDECGMLNITEIKKKTPSGEKLYPALIGIFQLGSKEQVILEEHFITDLSVIGCGDVDGDDKVDYLIRLSSEEYSRKMLYLSSVAGDGEILGLACQEDFGYCC